MSGVYAIEVAIKQLGLRGACFIDGPRVSFPESEIESLAAAVTELVESHKALLETVEHLDTAEGVCCCGDDMERHAHPMSCGHEPVDAGHYYHGQAISRARAAIARVGGAS